MSKKIGFIFLISSLVFLLTLFGYFVWKWKKYVSTDAVFVQADRLVYLSFPKVNGRITKLYKNEGEWVEKGELLAEIDTSDYRVKVGALEETIQRVLSEQSGIAYTLEKSRREIDLKIEQTEREIKGLEEQRRAQSAKIEALRARLKFLIKERNRREILYKDGLISLQSLEVIETEEKELGHQIEAEKALLRSIEEKLEVLKKNLLLIENERIGLKSLKAQLTALSHQEKALQAQRDEANLYLSYSQLKSPFSGYIAKKFHNEGDVIAPGEPIYALVDPESFYLLVLLEENKLKGVVVGARAKIKLDAYPDKVWKGEVETILPASAATFALVPRDISAGEFTKLSQRIPVKIRFTEGDRSLLRVGLSGKVEIERKIK